MQKGEKAWQKHPVFRLDLNASEYRTRADLENIIDTTIFSWEKKFGQGEKEHTLSARFAGCIQRAYEKPVNKSFFSWTNTTSHF